MRREGSRGLSRRSLFPIHPEGFFPSLAPSSYPVLLSAQPYLFISFFLHGDFLDLSCSQILKADQQKFLKGSIYRKIQISIIIYLYIQIWKNPRSLSPTTMPPGRKERGRHSLSFLNRSDHFSHSLLFVFSGWFVSSSYLRNSLSSFVIILGERIGINFVEVRL